MSLTNGRMHPARFPPRMATSRSGSAIDPFIFINEVSIFNIDNFPKHRRFGASIIGGTRRPLSYPPDRPDGEAQEPELAGMARIRADVPSPVAAAADPESGIDITRRPLDVQAHWLGGLKGDGPRTPRRRA